MDKLRDELAALIKAAKDMVSGVKSAERGFTQEEETELDGLKSQIEAKKAEIERAEKSMTIVSGLEELFAGTDGAAASVESGAKSLGEHFAKEIGAEGFAKLKQQSGVTLATSEFKANTDTVVTGGPASGAWQPWLTDVDKSLVRGTRQRPVIADLLGVGTVSGNAITYFVEGQLEGDFATVAETGQKPQISITNPTPETDPIRKMAAWFDVSDEMAEDLPFYVSEINNRGLYALAMAEEYQLLRGNGTGTNILGLLNRDGVQVEEYADEEDLAEAIFRSVTKIQTATGLSADGVIINPADYQRLRLSKDGNGQYFGGGFFSGQYGQGGIVENPPIWGLRTIVTAAAEAGKPVVGAFKSAATVYRKGGVRVESTNSDGGKFTSNIITTRIEQRIGLAARVPSAVVQVQLEGADGD